MNAGPFGQDPLQAGIMIIPFGIGIMSAGFIAGVVSDKLGVRNMIILGPLCTLAACAAMSKMDRNTTQATVGGLLYLAGCGVGLFQVTKTPPTAPQNTAHILTQNKNNIIHTNCPNLSSHYTLAIEYEKPTCW